MWKKFDVLPEIHYHDEPNGVELYCSVDILAWKRIEDYPEKNEEVVATVKGKLLYGIPNVSIHYLDKQAQRYLHVQKAIQEAKEIIEIELNYAQNP